MSVVVQSFHADPPAWVTRCLDSVRAWTAAAGHAYRFVDDGLFNRVPEWARAKTAHRPMVASDLARLYLLGEILGEGETAIWLDADVFVADPDALTAHLDLSAGYLLGREHWVQPAVKNRPRVRRSVHNALCAFRPDNPFRAFYADAAERILARHDGKAMVPQLLGPKFLTALDNMMGLPATPAVNMASPLVLADLAAGGGPALADLHAASPIAPAALNLCQSYTGANADAVAVTPELMDAAIDRFACDAIRMDR